MIPDQSSQWIVNANVDYLSAGGGCGQTLTLDIADYNEQSKSTKVHAGRNSASVQMEIPDGSVDRWWPKPFVKPQNHQPNLDDPF